MALLSLRSRNGALKEMPPWDVSALRPLVSPVSISPGFPGGIRFWAHPTPGPIRLTGCSFVERKPGVTPFPITV